MENGVESIIYFNFNRNYPYKYKKTKSQNRAECNQSEMNNAKPSAIKTIPTTIASNIKSPKPLIIKKNVVKLAINNTTEHKS